MALYIIHMHNLQLASAPVSLCSIYESPLIKKFIKKDYAYTLYIT